MSLRHLGIDAGAGQLFQRLASRASAADASMRARPEVMAKNTLGQSGLWGRGISGHLPIVLVRVVESDDLSRGTDPARAGLLAARGAQGRRRDPQRAPRELPRCHARAARAARRVGSLGTHHGQPGAVVLLRGDSMPEEERILLQTVSRAILNGDRGDLAEQLGNPEVDLPAAPPSTPPHAVARAAALPEGPQDDLVQAPIPPLTLPNGTGGFGRDGSEYVIVLEGDRETPLPWSTCSRTPPSDRPVDLTFEDLTIKIITKHFPIFSYGHSMLRYHFYHLKILPCQ